MIFNGGRLSGTRLPAQTGSRSSWLFFHRLPFFAAPDLIQKFALHKTSAECALGEDVIGNDFFQLPSIQVLSGISNPRLGWWIRSGGRYFREAAQEELGLFAIDLMHPAGRGIFQSSRLSRAAPFE